MQQCCVYIRVMELSDPAEALRARGLRVTALRMELIALLHASDRALGQQELEARSMVASDRVSIFRSLDVFERAGLVHRVLDANGTARYATCAEGCTPETHADRHAHFHCVRCDGLFCLPSVTVPKVALPKGFRCERVLLDVEGVCKSCR